MLRITRHCYLRRITHPVRNAILASFQRSIHPVREEVVAGVSIEHTGVCDRPVSQSYRASAII